ncbi:MAG: hypothetical protein HFG34_12655 [Eubacterium sp.]|nr:hypothetical protein [Eubacterium sp.]
MAVSSIGTYSNVYESVSVMQKKDAEASGQKRAGDVHRTSGSIMEKTEGTDNEEYLRSLQNQVPYTKLEIGSALSMKKDKRAGVITVNPKLLEKMQKDPEAAAQYTQKLKDIERAERTANAYYNSLGGVVERTSHWYVDEEGNHYHFAYTRRDDRLNKKIREETKKNTEKHIEKTRKKASEKAEKLEEQLEKKAEEAKEKEKNQETKTKEIETPEIREEVQQLIDTIIIDEGLDIKI